MARRSGFTLVELLVVVLIIAVLVALFLPTVTMIMEVRIRLHCQTNLKKIYNISMEYAAHYDGFLPCTCGFDSIQELQGPHGSPPDHFYKVEALMKFGAQPEYYCCPAWEYKYDQVANEDISKYRWKSWWLHDMGEYCFKYVKVWGYNFFIGADNAYVNPHDANKAEAYEWWPWPLSGNNGDRLQNGRRFAKRSDDMGNPPLACDSMVVSSEISGFFHNNHRVSLGGDDSTCTEPGGGGHTLFLNGAVYWYDWGDLEAQGPGYYVNGGPAYYFGLEAPKN